MCFTGSSDRGDHSIEQLHPYYRLQLFGTKETVESIINRLHSIGFVDRVYWGKPMPVPGVEGEWVSVLQRRW
ncbi:hypothetical protein [Alkalinema sp. FACHB-956]|uniref:hypothetical protein n=1 Tax=Alkalinema sp. FACHB-956 TaxID=2692768 RepID=UPI001684D9CC|nr:hypothetical protein [Alkalinema sp. FACHB-956]MBD2327123.1 hypothetical protein [Alkalinema sp. FACHB-956]